MILILEDDESMGNLLKKYLHLEGLKSTVVSSSSSALELLKHQNFKIIIFDIGLKGENGLDFVKKVRRKKYSTKLVCSSAHSDLLTGPLMDLGVRYALQKPYSKNDLLAIVFEILKECDQLAAKVA